MQPLVIKDFISEDIISILTSFIVSQPQNRINRTEIPYNSLNGIVRERVTFLRSRVKQIITEEYNPLSLCHDFTLLQANYPGDGHILHSDNSKQVGDSWIDNHTPHRTYSAGLYLNQFQKDFKGGELVFPLINLSLKVGPGMLVVFPSNENYLHQVNQITEGVRLSILLWFTDDKNKEELTTL